MTTTKRAVFLDRDGTINVEVGYLHRVEDVELIPGAGSAVARLNKAGFTVVVVTNQAGIARGLYGHQAVEQVHKHIACLLARNEAHIDAFYYCPHHPDFGGACHCRKPLPGMLEKAALEHNLRLDQSWLVGDTLGDMVAGTVVGCRTVLVQTGHGSLYADSLLTRESQLQYIATDLPAAVELILAYEPQQRALA
ncbi:MAG: D-glycero-beta-D-manno-heptose 1,7-bisphosphate 7-phosphatase [Herpetosiphon sp.]